MAATSSLIQTQRHVAQVDDAWVLACALRLAAGELAQLTSVCVHVTNPNQTPSLAQLWPASLSCDYSFNAIPPVQAWTDPRNLATATLYITLVALVLCSAIKQVWRGRLHSHLSIFMLTPPMAHKHTDLARAVGYPVAAAPLPACLQCVHLRGNHPRYTPTNTRRHADYAHLTAAAIAGERLLYLPSVGACMLLAWLLCKAPLRRQRRSLLRVTLLALLVAGGAWRTARRNQDWASPLTLYSADVATQPQSAKLHLNLAVTLMEDVGTFASSPALSAWASRVVALLCASGDLDAAAAALNRSVALFPTYSGAFYVRGLLAEKQRSSRTAIKSYKRAVQCHQHNCHQLVQALTTPTADCTGTKRRVSA